MAMVAEGLVEKRAEAKAAKGAEKQASTAVTTSASGGATSAPSSATSNGLGGTFGVVLLGLALLGVNAMIGTRINPSIFLAVFIFVVFGSLAPFLGVPIGALILIALILKHSDVFVGKLDVFTGYGGK